MHNDLMRTDLPICNSVVSLLKWVFANKLLVQLNPTSFELKGPTKSTIFRQNSVREVKENRLKGQTISICEKRSDGAGFPCTWFGVSVDD